MRLLLALALALLALPIAAGSGQMRLGQLNGANFNSTADQTIPIHFGRYAVRRITVQNCSAFVKVIYCVKD